MLHNSATKVDLEKAASFPICRLIISVFAGTLALVFAVRRNEPYGAIHES